ncbi:serendipity locus protein delta [Teleopsis dalmanni]|uniref:serendipity locus protein delta n=1 Tax=Teleopsis dalmanni TaxID=139649 RepID=UPI0018CE3CAB|nr:serendipity locus protein delta [Teleopsis dalmanni]
MDQCFLCGNGNTDSFYTIETTNAPYSQRPLEMVFKHLGKIIKIDLVFRGVTKLCTNCFDELSDYDEVMVKLMSFQNNLTKKLELCIGSKYENQDEILSDGAEFLIEETSDKSTIEEDLIETVCSSKEETSANDPDDFIIDCDNNSNKSDSPRKRPTQDCVICDTSFKSKFRLQEHMKVHHDSKDHSCNICGAIRRDEEYLELHMNIHEGKKETECRYCPKQFARPVNTLRHMRKHWDQKKYQCEKCGERFSLDNMLYNHRMRHEAEENPLICSICKQSFKSRKTYNHHIIIHQENRPRHHCTICKKSFTERYSLKMHMKTHGKDCPQTVEEILVEAETDKAVCSLTIDNGEEDCLICNMKFENRNEYEKHAQNFHSDIIP